MSIGHVRWVDLAMLTILGFQLHRVFDDWTLTILYLLHLACLTAIMQACDIASDSLGVYIT